MKRKPKIKILICLISVLFIGVITYILYPKKVNVVMQEILEAEINSDVNNLEYIKEVKNGKIISEVEKIDTSKLGSQKVVVLVQNKLGKKEEITYQILVVDKEAPQIEFKKNLETKKGVKIDLLANVVVKDNSNETIIPTIEGEYNINKVGEYKLAYVAKDKSGNETKEEFTLKVKEGDSNSLPSINPTDDVKYFTTSKGFEGVTINGVTYIDGYLVVNKTYSLPANYGTGLTKETKAAFEAMNAIAKTEGLNIWLQSGFRSYDTQNTIYNRYVSRDGKEKADTYSARPGHSEHQSGLAFDVNQINDTFIGSPEAIWLQNNCYKYGFILRYPKDKTNETGYKYESWHFRYVGEELALKLYNNGDWLTMEDYFGITSEYSE